MNSSVSLSKLVRIIDSMNSPRVVVVDTLTYLEIWACVVPAQWTIPLEVNRTTIYPSDSTELAALVAKARGLVVEKDCISNYD